MRPLRERCIALQSSLAAMPDLAQRTLELVDIASEAREELPVSESALGPLLAREPALGGADLVLMMEPTANAVQAGCLGNVNATWTFSGVSGHSARPWLADNALEHAARGVLALAEVPRREHAFDGLRFVETASVTMLSGGVAAKFIPPPAVAPGNYRPPPGGSAAAPHAGPPRLR